MTKVKKLIYSASSSCYGIPKIFPTNEESAIDPKYPYALTKYMGGHGSNIGGVLVDSGKFPWAEHASRFKRLNEPDPSYHGVIYTEALGPAAYIGRARVVPLRNTGSAISPMNSFMILQGIETLPVRMDRHCENAIEVANYLSKHDKVDWVR